MPALLPTDHVGTIRWLGRVEDRAASLGSAPLTEVQATFGGVAGEAHGGLTRPSCVRVKAQYPEGTEIRNVRQFTILSVEDLDAIATEMGVEALDPAWLGASMVIAGIGDFSHVPPSSRLQGESGATLVVDMQNRPCTLPARLIEEAIPGAGKRFKPAAVGRRGVTAWVEREGRFGLGDAIRLHVPDQRPWNP
ncbi:MAG: MOSC domain-containing protein [Rhodobacteraceae bacterium]|nr:MOSC domain-containing protein [Paracoccaceae bacterium]